jgi:hypothetical protein
MIDETIFRNVLKEIKENPKNAEDIIDSFSDNQFKSKTKVLNCIDKLDILSKESEIVIFGSWYGSILIPGLAEKVKRITCIDLDEQVLKIAKNRLFPNVNNVDYIPGNVFDLDLKRYHDTDLFINTSCEHMPPMKEWPYWPQNTNFVFTSNNMYDIEGHVNCVDSMTDFKSQLPINATVLSEDEITDERGTRFIVAGKIVAAN